MTTLREILAGFSIRASFLRLTAVTVATIVVFGILTPSVFLSGRNLQYLALSTPELALLALAIAVSMLTGGIDLSVVAIANLSGIVAAIVMRDSAGGAGIVVLGVAAGLLTAAVAGLVNGAIIAGFGVTPILATLGTSQAFAGLGLVLTRASVIKGLPARFSAIAEATIAGVPLVFVILLLVAGVVAFLLTRTVVGMRLRLMGANDLAARFTGFRMARLTLVTYAWSGTLAGIAGLIVTSRASGADSTYGGSYLLLAIVIAVLAGVDPEGGYITVAGVCIATLAMQILASGLLALRLDSHIVNIAQGALLILMMVLNRYEQSWTQWPRAVAERFVGSPVAAGTDG